MNALLLYAVAVLAGILFGSAVVACLIVFVLVPPIRRPGRPPKTLKEENSK